MKRLRIIARHYTGLMQVEGMNPEYDDVLGELTLAYCQGVKKYRETEEHAASENTYLERCYERKMWRHISSLREIKEVRLATDVPVKDGTHIRLQVQEAVKSMSHEERTILDSMLSKGSSLNGNEKGLNWRRSVLAIEVAARTGLKITRVEVAINKISTLMLEAAK